MIDLAQAQAHSAPLVIWCDDAQWADEATLALLGRLARLAPRHAIMLIIGYRAEEIADNAALNTLLRMFGPAQLVRTIVLRRLDTADVQQFVAAAANTAPERVGSLAGQLAILSGGNPLFLTIAIESLVEAHAAATLGQVLPQLDTATLTDLAGATRVRDLVIGRLERLPPAARLLAEQLAIIGRPVSLDLIEQLGGGEALAAAQILIERRLLIEHEGLLGFAHDLVGAAIGHALAAPQRGLLLGQAAAAIAALTPIGAPETAELVRHLRAAGRGVEQQLVAAAVDAGDHARRAAGYRAALAYYDTALAAAERAGAAMAAELVQRAFAGRLLSCEALLDLAGVQATISRHRHWHHQQGDTGRLVAPRRMVLLHALAGDLAGAARLSAAARTDEGEAPTAITDLHTRMARILQPPAALPVAVPPWPWPEVVFAAAGKPAGDPAAELPAVLGADEAALVLFQIGWALLMEGHVTAAASCLQRSYDLAHETGQAALAVIAALQLAHHAALTGDRQARDSWLTQSLATAERAPEAGWASIWPGIHQGFLWLLDDQAERAAQRFDAMAERLAGLPAFQGHRASVQVGQGLAALALRQPVQALAALNTALASPQLLYGFVYVAAQHGAARLAAQHGALDHARRLLYHGLEYSRERRLLPEYVRSVIEIVRIERDFGDPAGALALLAAATAHARAAGLMPLALAAGAIQARLMDTNGERHPPW